MVVSRGDAELVKRLFEQEVPEIYDGTVTIRGCAREAGERTKIAVSSRDRDVDSVGACVGMKGMRVQSIIRELRGEKIDIIEFSEDPVQFATHALSPAKISRVTILDPAEHTWKSLWTIPSFRWRSARRDRTSGWRPSCWAGKSISRAKKRSARKCRTPSSFFRPGRPVSALIEHGLAEATVDALVRGDIGTVEKLGSMTPEQLEALEGIDEEAVGRIQQAINSFYGQEYAPRKPAVGRSGGARLRRARKPDPGSSETVGSAESHPLIRWSESAEAAAEAGVEGHSAADSG